MGYALVKWIHVLLAITAVGANITYGVWLARARKDAAVLPFVLRGIKMIDDRIANPCYVLLLVTGLVMAWMSSIPFTTPWLLTSLVLYVALAIVGFVGYTPALRRQIEALDRGGVTSVDYLTQAKRGQIYGAVLAALVTAITFLMVVKPGLWV